MPCSKGMRSCYASCLHRQLVSEYRDTRHAWETLRESSTVVDAPGAAGANVAAYQLEETDFRRQYPAPTFKEWLRGNKGRNTEPA